MRHAYETEKPKPSMRQLAERFGVSVSTVSNIINRRYWKD
jgi:DNA-binding transcriptional regulator YhcF (GntR family)